MLNAKLNSLFALLIFFAACNSNNSAQQNSGQEDVLRSHIDTTVNPGVDFWSYTNGAWFKSNPIPASESSNGIFKMVDDTINKDVREICEKAAADSTAAKGSNTQKIGDLYASGMDTVQIEKDGISPLAGEFKKIDAINGVKDLMDEVAHLYTMGAGPMFSFYVARDDKNSSKYACFVWQGGLGLGDRDYYFNTDSRTANIRAEYVKHLAKMFALLGDNSAASDAHSQVVMKMETSLAAASRKLEDTRDPYKNYNKKGVAQMQWLTPSINWAEMLSEMGVNGCDTLILGQPEFLSGLEKSLHTYSIDDWKQYMRWNLINTAAPYLSKAFDQENFHFYATVMSGVPVQRPRWKRVVETTNNNLGDLVGQEFVKSYLPAGTKDKLIEIGNALKTVYAKRIQDLTWMSADTKKYALYKLGKINMKLGYPDKWKDMSSLTIDRGPYVLNLMRAGEWQFQYMVHHFGQPMDRNEWDMEPQTYNAYYDPTNNEIVIPACNIIVPGYSSNELPDDAVIYGIVAGSTMGHELTHGFDDQGSQYDAQGNLHNWWTKQDSIQFHQRTQMIVKQFDKYNPVDTLHVNGEATQGENIADLGGAILGYEAFKMTKQGQSDEKIGGFTPDQRYFLSFAYSWMVQARKESIARQLMTDVHSPAQYRIDGPLSDVPAFYTAFDVKPGDPMYRSDSLRVKIW
jgi:putative endopeptidase